VFFSDVLLVSASLSATADVAAVSGGSIGGDSFVMLSSSSAGDAAAAAGTELVAGVAFSKQIIIKDVLPRAT